MKKNYLDIEDDSSFCGLAIFSYIKPVKLIWEINQHLSLAFERIEDISNENIISLHTQFMYYYEDYECTIKIIKNKGSEGFLFNSKIEIPYFMIFLGGEMELAQQDCLEKLKTLENLTAIQAVEPKILNKLAVYL